MNEVIFKYKKFDDIGEISLDAIDYCQIMCMDKNKVSQYLQAVGNVPVVYFLFNEIERQVYVGYSITPCTRFKSHCSNDWWNEALIITSKKFTDSCVRYIESYFISSISKNLLYNFKNQQNSPILTVSSSEKSLCEQIIDQINKIFELRRYNFYKAIESKTANEIFVQEPVISSTENYNVIIQPCGKAGRKNFDNTILKHVDLSSKNLGISPVWGVHKEKYYNVLNVGDHVYFGNDRNGLFYFGQISNKFIDENLAVNLWNDGNFKYIYTLENFKETNIPLEKFNLAIGYMPNAPIQCFKVLNNERLKLFIDNFENQS